MQDKVAFLRACGFTQKQVTSLVEKHTDILLRAPGTIVELLRVIGDLFGCSQDMDMLKIGNRHQTTSSLPFQVM